MGTLLDLYKLRLKVFLGVFKVSKISIALFVLYALSMVPGAFGISFVVADSVKRGADLLVYLEAFSAVISGVIAIALLLTWKGFTVFEYEQNFIFTSSILPIQFLVSGLLADLTVFSFFLFPVFLFLGIVSVSLNLAAAATLSMAIIVVSFVFFLVFLKTSMSILDSVYQKLQIKITSSVLVFLLLFPALGMFNYSPIKYGDLPYPSTILAQSLLSTFSGEPLSITMVLGSAAYFISALALFLYASKKNLFQFASPVPFVSPFDSSMRMQTIKTEKNIKFFSRRSSMKFSLNIRSKSLLRFLMKKEMIRMTRDGSLFSVFIFYLIVFGMSLVSGSRGTLGSTSMFLLAVYSFIIPSMLISTWRMTELNNLWVPLTSGLSLSYVVRPLLYNLTLIAFAVPAAAMGLLTLINRFDPLISLVLVASASMIGCSANLYVMMHFIEKKSKATPSLMINWISMLLSGIFMAPAYIYAGAAALLSFSWEINIVASAVIVAYSAAVFLFLSKRLEKRIPIIEV